MPIIRTWDNDITYVADQSGDSSWSHRSEYGQCAAWKFVEYGRILRSYGWLYHDDTVADFGGNDGFAARAFYDTYGIKPLVVDCEPERLRFAKNEYGLPTLECFVEDIPLPDNSIDWGFCSHMIEHARDPERAIAEIARVVKRACMFMLPIEPEQSARENTAHSVYATSLREWKGWFKPAWIIKGAAYAHARNEAQIFARPRRNGHGSA